MFARLTGRVDQLTENSVILDVNGVGYLATCSRRTLGRLNAGEIARLHIETHVREDAINLYGFIDADEQAWFRLLTTVQGVGARVGLSILSALTPDDIGLAIAAQDKTMLTRADGVGPKLATRIVTELKDKVPEGLMRGAVNLKTERGASKARGMTDAGSLGVEGGGSLSADADAISALVNLGYGRAEAFSAVIKIKTAHPDAGVADMIRLALAELVRNAA